MYFNTWIDPATRVFHAIDLIVMREKQRVLCRDVQVMRGSNCWTEHKMVRVKLRIELPHAYSLEEGAVAFCHS